MLGLGGKQKTVNHDVHDACGLNWTLIEHTNENIRSVCVSQDARIICLDDTSNMCFCASYAYEMKFRLGDISTPEDL